MTSKPRHPLRRLPLMLMLCGLLGAMGVAVGSSGLLSWREPIPELPAIALPDPPPGEEAAWARIQEAIDRVPDTYHEVLKQRRPAVTALAATNLVSSGVLLIGVFAARLRRPWSVRSLRAGISLSQAYAILALAVQCWVQIGLLAGQRAVFEPLAAEGGTTATMAVTLMAAQMGVIVVTAVLALAQLGFFVWAGRMLRRPGAAEALGAGAGPGQGT
ncbi:MAG TPA: hypothetical protein VGD74_06290 [Vulgatibacter sp.]